MKSIVSKFKNQKVAELRVELSRAHLIIGLLALACVLLLAQSTLQPVELEPLLSAICVSLLILVAITSLAVSFTLRSMSKK